MCGSRITYGVRNVHGRGTSINGCFDYIAKEIPFRSRRIFRRKLDVITIADRTFHSGHCPVDDLLARHPQLEFPVDGTRCQEYMNPSRFGVLQGFPGTVNVGG